MTAPRLERAHIGLPHLLAGLCRCLLASLLALLSAHPASAQDAPGNGIEQLLADPSAEIADPVAYMNEVLDIMEADALVRDSIDWPSFRSEALRRAEGSESTIELYRAVGATVGGLGDGHSMFSPDLAPLSSGAEGDDRSTWGRLVGDRVGYLWVPAFSGSEPAPSQGYAGGLQEHIADLDRAGACGWIVDLRGNGGGNMYPMLVGVGPVLGAGESGALVEPDGTRRDWAYRDGAAFLEDRPWLRLDSEPYSLDDPDPPVAVLIGPATASSGELVAVAFRGRPDTRLFGGTTAGLTTGNEEYDLSDGSRLILTVSVFQDRRGRTYGGVVEPDVRAEPSEVDEPSPDDAVVAAAVEWLESHDRCLRSPTAR